MKLTKFEQSGFILETDSGFKMALDIGVYTPLEKLEGLEVDAFLVSHIHGDHFSSEHIKKLNPKKVYLNSECIEALEESLGDIETVKIKEGEDVDINGIKVQSFSVDHGPNISLVPKENFGFLFKVDEKTIYFAGDMFYKTGIPTEDLEVDYALIPVGTFYTFGPQEAFEFIQTFKNIDKVVSMHYEKTPETKEEFAKIAEGTFSIENL